MYRSRILPARNNDVFTQTHTPHTHAHIPHMHTHTYSCTSVTAFTVTASCCVWWSEVCKPFLTSARLDIRLLSQIRSLCEAARRPGCGVRTPELSAEQPLSCRSCASQPLTCACVTLKDPPRSGSLDPRGRHTYWWDSVVKLPVIKVTPGCIPPQHELTPLHTPVLIIPMCTSWSHWQIISASFLNPTLNCLPIYLFASVFAFLIEV